MHSAMKQNTFQRVMIVQYRVRVYFIYETIDGVVISRRGVQYKPGIEIMIL